MKGRSFSKEDYATPKTAGTSGTAFKVAEVDSTSSGTKLASPQSPLPKSLVEGVKVLLGEFALLIRDSAVNDEILRK